MRHTESVLSRPRRPWAVVLLALGACSPASDLVTGSAERQHVLLLDEAPAIDSVVPAAAPTSVGAEVTIYLRNTLALPTSVTAGGTTVPLLGVAPGVARAHFAPVPSDSAGPRDVAVTLADGGRATGAGAFHYLFEQDPIVFTHGCPLPANISNGSETNYHTSRYWRPMYERLREEYKYPAPKWRIADTLVIPTQKNARSYLWVFSLSEDSTRKGHRHDPSVTGVGGHCGSALDYARELDAFVDSVRAVTGAPRVDLLVNSAGGMGARYYLQQRGGAAKVRDVVFLAGMNHGTDMALFVQASDAAGGTFFHPSPNYDGAREGAPAYSCKGEALRDIQFIINGCLRPGPLRVVVNQVPNRYHPVTNPQGVAYRSIYNPIFDELIEPTTSACLNQQYIGDCTDPINVAFQVPGSSPHGDIRRDPTVMDSTITFIMRRSHQQQ